MPVWKASELLTRAMRVRFKEAFFPANQSSRKGLRSRRLAEAGNLNRDFGQALLQQTSVYTGTVDQFGCPGNTVDSWRLEFIQSGSPLNAANQPRALKTRQG